MKTCRRSILAMLGALPIARMAWAGPAAIRFGILPIGGALDSRNDWEPLLQDMSKALGQPVSLLSVTSYDALEQAIRRGEVDMAFLSGKMALDAVTLYRMRVLAQVTRHDGLSGYRSILLTRRGVPPLSVREVLAQPERWRLARGEKNSLSGFVVPQLQLFLPNGIAMETRFKSEIIGTHQTLALAVANGEVDVAINNSADFERFALQFPAEAGRLQVIWQSELIAHAQIVLRASFAPEFALRVQNFLTSYARGASPEGDEQRAVLKALHNLAGFRVADNGSLRSAAQLDYELARQNALQAHFIDEAARRTRLERVERTYAQQLRILNGAAPR